MTIIFERSRLQTQNFAKIVIYVYFESKKSQECECMRVYSVKENIEGDATLKIFFVPSKVFDEWLYL